MTINIQPIEKRSRTQSGETLDVHSIFRTIQGEGPYTGERAVFIRLAGCNLQCPMCDTEYTSGRAMMHVSEIQGYVTELLPLHQHLNANHRRLNLVVITGGEPLRQNLEILIHLLNDIGYTVQIETNGTLPPPASCPPSSKLMYVVSPKTPRVHPQLEHYAYAYKYVLDHRSIEIDGLPKYALAHEVGEHVARPPANRTMMVYLQPVDAKDDELNAKNLAAVVESCQAFGYRLQLQVHKLINVE